MRPSATTSTTTSGAPNGAVRAVNGMAADHVDRGLLDNPAIDDPAQAGRFKVPTLRNVAVTGPYMHNGVFRICGPSCCSTTSTTARARSVRVNPETGEQWRAPEVPGYNLAVKELETGPALDDRRIDALVAFMKTLTDARYEHLLTD